MGVHALSAEIEVWIERMESNGPHFDRLTVAMSDLRDQLGRPLRDLRVSVTDRCNFRCPYCMPKEQFGARFSFLPRREILTFEEIAILARIFRSLGVRKSRLTGGEPLLRAELPVLIRLLSQIPKLEVALTTNGSLLIHQAEALAQAGLSRVTVSLDSLDDRTFRAMNDVEMPVARVLDGIEAAARAGLAPIKINAGSKRGVNDRRLADFARKFTADGHIVRFIEYMDVGTTNGWRLDDVVPAQEIIERIASQAPLEPVAATYRGEVAKRWRRMIDGPRRNDLVPSRLLAIITFVSVVPNLMAQPVMSESERFLPC